MFGFREIHEVREARGNLSTRQNTGYDIPNFDIDPDVRIGDCDIPLFSKEGDIPKFDDIDPDRRIGE